MPSRVADFNVRAEEFLAAVLGTAAEPIVAVDSAGVIRFANGSAAEALGYARADELIGRDGGELLPDGQGSAVGWFCRRDGSRFSTTYTSTPLATPEGPGAVIVFANVDGTERELLDRLSGEQAALRRVATLVARSVPPVELFSAVARELGQLLDTDSCHIARFEGDETVTVVGTWSRAGDHVAPGTRIAVDGVNVCSSVLRTGRPARIETYEGAPGEIAALLRRIGIRSSVGAPIVVDERVWGVALASSKTQRTLPLDTEPRIGGFSELVAAAISNSEARAEMRPLEEEQAALRRVATLVAQGVPSDDLFAAVAAEVGGLLHADLAGMSRYVDDDTVAAVATWSATGEHPPVQGRYPLTRGGHLSALILETGGPARIDDWAGVEGPSAAIIRDVLGARSSVGSPIMVEGRAWGALYVHSRTLRGLPADTESRLENFTDLVATSISNAHARTEVRRLADEQAALRRVATLVARQPSPEEVFAAVTAEVGALMGVEHAFMYRYEPDGSGTIVAGWGDPAHGPIVGTRLTLEGENLAGRVLRSGRSARIDDFATATGAVAGLAREVGIHAGVGAPILVQGRLWGSMIAAGHRREPLPADTEARMSEFTELVATAISNIQARADLAASRARVVTAADDERRRVVRDLHDGAQQRLVQTIVTLKLARQAVDHEQHSVPGLVGEALEHAERATAELRELAQGILPSVLTLGGLDKAVATLAERTPVPVESSVAVGRLSESVEATAYFVVAEGLTNVAKHARAAHATVSVRVVDGALEVCVSDDGAGGARVDGSGLVGLRDRVAALDGRLHVESPTGRGTRVTAAIPLGS